MNRGNPNAPGSLKKVLVVHYSQTGQLSAVLEQITGPLRAERRLSLTVENLVPLRPFPFPWPFFRFLDAFPESAHLVPLPLAPLSLTGDEDFDLIIVPYQVWFLAPSQPIAAFLMHPAVKRVVHGKPVVTIIACRNMWLMAQEKVRGLLARAGARLIDNVVLADQGPTMATFITTPRWLLSGKKEGIWGLPAAGLTDEQIRGARRFGLALRDALLNDQEKGTQPLLAGLAAAEVDPRLYLSEKTGNRSFFVWGKLLLAAGPAGSARRVPLLVLYVVFLVLMIITVVPLSLTVQALLRPLLRSRLSRIKARFEEPSGSSRERLELYGH